MDRIVGVRHINDLGNDSPYKISAPIRVVLSEGDGKIWASAPELCMAVDGVGADEEEAVNNLKQLIVIQQESHDSMDRSELAGTMKFTIDAFNEHLQKAG